MFDSTLHGHVQTEWSEEDSERPTVPGFQTIPGFRAPDPLDEEEATLPLVKEPG